MDIRLTFDAVVETYERVRPSYPTALFDSLFDAWPAEPTIIEIGPGTGQATVDLLARGAHVTAVELGPQLAERLQQRFGSEERLNVINDSFEQAPLSEHSFNGIAVATAYHWIETQAQVKRPAQLLRPGGVLGVIDLIQVDSASDQGYFERVQPIYERYSEQKSSWVPKPYETAEPAIAARLGESALYRSVEVLRVPWDQTYSASQYRDLLWTYSGTQMMAEPDRTRMVDELVAVVEGEFGGTVTRPLAATLTMARTR